MSALNTNSVHLKDVLLYLYALYYRLFYNSFGKTTEHGGTHMDAPMHMFDSKKRPNLWFMDQVPPERLVGPGVVIDVADKAEKNRDYELTKEDVLAWERKNGKIPAGAIVLMHSGWEKYFKNTTAYFGTAKTNEVTHYPGFHANACRLLVERGVYGVGSDTASSDNGPSVDFPCHPILLGKNIWIMEMVANTGKLPAKGFTLFAMPMKIGEGSGAPTRMFAMFPSDLKPYSHSSKLLITSFTLLLSMVFLLII